MSYLARPTRGLDTGALAIRVGLAVADAAEDLGVMVGLKWPNDVLLWDRKLAGILCEARWQRDRLAWVAIGIGINVHGPVPAPLAGRAVALSEALPSVNRLGLLERLVPRLATMPDAAHLDRDELARYRRRDWLFDRCLAEPVRGMAQGVDASGALLVQTARGLERVVGGSVTCC